MKEFIRSVVVGGISALAVWWFAVPSRYDMTLRVFSAAQIGDNRKTIQSLLGPPSKTEISQKGQIVKEGLHGESYSFLLIRHVFYYDDSGHLADKRTYQSE